MRHRSISAGVIAFVMLLAAARSAPGGEALVTKMAESFQGTPWTLDKWSTAPGKVSRTSDAPDGVDAQRCMTLKARFSGQGFGWTAVRPRDDTVIPGELRAMALWCKADDTRFPVVMKFKDGWGREKVDDKNLEWVINPSTAGVWERSTFTVPRGWVQPISILSLITHNWSHQDARATVEFRISSLEATTDIAQVDPATGILRSWRANPDPTVGGPPAEAPRTPVVVVDITTDAPANVFAHTSAKGTLRVRNWTPGALSGTVKLETIQFDGDVVETNETPLRVEDYSVRILPLRVNQYGRHLLRATFSFTDGSTLTKELPFARIPTPRGLAGKLKTDSPYGINVHGGRDDFTVEPFANAGLIWFRDYAWQYDWMLRAKGDDGTYAGWPDFQHLNAVYRDAQVLVVPCLQRSIKRPEGGRIGPDQTWRSQLADMVRAFPNVTHWELSNEYDLDGENAKAEDAIDWANYRAYHKAFAEVLADVGGGKLIAVEQGRAGIWPARERACVTSGDFDRIGVINNHHYCGTDAPEVNSGNFNTGFDTGHVDQAPALFFDRLREVKRAASADGAPRESWLTEFGWDTLAGNVVTPYEQAIYVPRAWMIAMAAGTDKCFWFYDYDSPTPKQFFDGCGLLDDRGNAKQSLCSLAALAWTLPTPTVVGEINAGAGTQGYVFETAPGVHGPRKTLVASLWSVTEDVHPTVRFEANRVRDYLGNRITDADVRLSRAPVYAVDIQKDSAWYRQTAYSIESRHLVVAAAGDSVDVTLAIANNRDEEIRCRIETSLPTGWSATHATAAFAVAPGARDALHSTLTISSAESLGRRQVVFVISEGNELKRMPLEVFVKTAIDMRADALWGPPGQTTVKIRLANSSSRPLGGTVQMRLPSTWKALVPQARLERIEPGQTRDLDMQLEWTPKWDGGEEARAAFVLDDGGEFSCAIIPNRISVPRAQNIALDGRLDEWPAGSLLPAWIVGSTLGGANTDIRLAWATEGIYCAVSVHDSVRTTADPRSFWNGDCLEVWIDTADDKRHRFFEERDHHFWFVPQTGTGAVYMGQWKHKDEIQATRYDVPCEGASRATDDGYVMEFLLPAFDLKQFFPRAGQRIGLNLNLTVKGRTFDREVYWHRYKEWIVQNLPKTWGSVELGE